MKLFSVYADEGGSSMCRKTLFKRLSEHHGDNVVILSSSGFANVMGFRNELSKSLYLVENENDALESAVDRVSTRIKTESLLLKRKTRDKYYTNIDKDLAKESASDTLSLLLSKISSMKSLSQILIGNIITSVVCCQPTDIQIALGVLMRRNKSLISEMYKYAVCCSYDEVRLFRYSAAVHVAQNYGQIRCTLVGTGNIVHCVCDNFDCEISSQNCKTSCHCLAMIMAQVHSPGDATEVNVNHRKTIPRQRMEHRSKTIE